MTKDQIKVVIRVLKDNIDKNEERIADAENNVIKNSIQFESAACVKGIKIFEVIGGVEND